MARQGLQALLRKLDKQYFAGRFAEYSVEFAAPNACTCAAARTNASQGKILIRLGLRDQNLPGVLLHQMAHAVSEDTHDLAWKREMIRIRALGAPLLEADSLIELRDWKAGRASPAEFAAFLSGFLLRDPSATLEVSVKRFIDDGRRAGRPKDYIRSCPWITDTFEKMRAGRARTKA